MAETKAIDRPDMKSDPKLESPRERAERRAKEIRDSLGGQMDEGNDKFYVDPSAVPDGWSYEWKMKTVMGAENPAYAVSLARKGWEPVPAMRHPEMMPLGDSSKEITRDGMILMERPMELTEESRVIEKRMARNQVRGKEDQLSAAPQGQFDRSNKDTSLVKVKKSYEAIPVPEE